MSALHQAKQTFLFIIVHNFFEMTESVIEKYVKEFVFDKTKERVELKLEDSIKFVPTPRTGSIALSMFWLRVFQDSSNFPRNACIYVKGSCKFTNQETISLLFSHLKFTVYLRTGEIM